MNFITRFFTVLSLLVFLGAAQSRASQICDSEAPMAVRFAIAYLSLLERGGLGLSDPVNENGRTINQLCEQLTATSIEANTLAGNGVETITLVLPDETCKIDVTLAPNGKVAKSYGMNCEK